MTAHREPKYLYDRIESLEQENVALRQQVATLTEAVKDMQARREDVKAMALRHDSTPLGAYWQGARDELDKWIAALAAVHVRRSSE
jgi:uncharacterized protein YlxW (UPF0749 family)